MNIKIRYMFNISKTHRSSLAFTIVELLVVIVVIGVLTAITIVAYTGISNRAIISSLQSDLANAATTLKLDQVTNSGFPATLALANNGNGITQSQSLDSIIYIPDNTSNPNNFCLMYRKGINTYAVDNNSSVSNGSCLHNLVTNGDFSSGASGWGSDGATLSYSGNILIATGNGTYSAPRPRQTIIYNSQSNEKFYVKYRIRVTNSLSTRLMLEFTNDKYTSAIIVTPPIANQWYDFSGVVTTQSNSSGNIYIYLTSNYTDAATASGKVSELQYISVISLTASFGAGNEPTKAQMDTIMNGYSNNWFNGTQKGNL